jgi:hypothetical protein
MIFILSVFGFGIIILCLVLGRLFCSMYMGVGQVCQGSIGVGVAVCVEVGVDVG